MARRDLSNLNSVTNVEATLPDQIEGIVAERGQEILELSQKAKVNELAAAAQLEIADLDEAYQKQNQGNPFGNVGKLNNARKSILNKYGSNIAPQFRGLWDEVANKIDKNEEASTKVWGYKQAQENTVLSINYSMRDTMMLASRAGSNFGRNGGDLTAMLNFDQAKGTLKEFAEENLGETEAAKLLFNFDRDYAKSFVAGVAEVSPEQAAALLESPAITEKFSPGDREDMTRLVQRTKSMQELNKSFFVTGNNGALTSLINDPEKSYFDKRLEIDKLELAGNVTPRLAAQARRVLTSQKNVDAITATPVMADWINKVYDLNAQSGLNNADYLIGVQNIQEGILKDQATGKLNALDVQKLNKQITTLTSKRVADATKSAGVEFYDANQTFESLPPEWRGSATRRLFYDTVDEEGLSAEQMKLRANKIMDDINKERRGKALKTASEASKPQITPQDKEFLSGYRGKNGRQYSLDDVRETARKYGISEAEVIKKLRAGK